MSQACPEGGGYTKCSPMRWFRDKARWTPSPGEVADKRGLLFYWLQQELLPCLAPWLLLGTARPVHSSFKCFKGFRYNRSRCEALPCAEIQWGNNPASITCLLAPSSNSQLALDRWNSQ